MVRPASVALTALLLCSAVVGQSFRPAAEPSSKPTPATDTELVRATRHDTDRCSEPGASDCRIQLGHALAEAGEMLVIQHIGNLPTYRGEMHGPFFDRWFGAVSHQRFSVWNDNDPFMVDYVGHPMAGATIGSILIQNDPKARRIGFENSRRYWASRAKALAFTAVYEAQWEIGPFSEASFGHLGSFRYYSKASGGMTNGTGLTDYFMTPLGGTAIVVAEDLVYTHLQKRMLEEHRNPLARLAISAMTPNRSFANLLRWHAPWSRN